MQTFDQSLMELVKQNLVTYEEALKHVSNPDDFALRFRGIGSTSDGTWEDFEEDEEEKQEKEEDVLSGDLPAGGEETEDDFIKRF
jgi:twitching motility protein PilT